MKTFFSKFAAIFFAVSASFALVSCGEGSKEEPEDPTALKGIEVVYSVELTEDYLYFYDVTVNYGFADSEGITEEIVTEMWSLDQKFDKDMVELPGRFFCKVTATPKNPAPEIDEAKTYAIKQSHAFYVYGLRNDGQESIMKMSKGGPDGLSLKGSKMPDLLAKGARKVADFDYER